MRASIILYTAIMEIFYIYVYGYIKVQFGFTFCVFLFFFFFLFLAAVVDFSSVYSAHFSNTSGSRALFTRLTNFTFQSLFIKNLSHGTIHIFKNYFATMFSIFSKISYIQTDPKSSPKIG